MRASFPYLSLLLWSSSTTGQQCAFTQTCSNNILDPNYKKGCTPIPLSAPPAPLVAAEYGCPAYKNNSCCNSVQNAALNSNFVEVRSNFGLSLGGNGACMQNVIDFWCAFTCAPDQSRFIDTHGFANMTDPFNILNPTALRTVLLTTYYVDKYWACGIYESCKFAVIPETLGATDCENFLNFLSEGGISAGSYTSFVLTSPAEEPRVETLPVLDCCSYPAVLDNAAGGAGNTSAPCAYCAGMCGGADLCYTTQASGTAAASGNSSSPGAGLPAGDAIDAPEQGAMFGFEALPIYILYGLLLAGSAAGLGGRAVASRCRKDGADDDAVTPRKSVVSLPFLGGSGGGSVPAKERALN